MKNNKVNIIRIILMLAIIISMFFIIPKIWDYIVNNYISDQKIINIDIENSQNTTWVSLFTWDTNPIPSDPIGFVYYQKENWVEWQDYFEIYFQNQETMNWKSVEENNKIMRNYIYNNKYAVNVWKMKEWYIIFTTKKPIADNRDLFLGLDWSSKWAIDRKYIKKSNYDNEYLFDINELRAWWYKINFQNYINSNWKIIIWWYVWEKDNTIKKITIIKK